MNTTKSPLQIPRFSGQVKALICLLSFLGGEGLPLSTQAALRPKAAAVALHTVKPGKQVAYASGESASLPDLTLSETQAILEKRLKNAGTMDPSVLARQIYWLCKRHGFRISFILSVIHAESGFNSVAASNRGAWGLMQLRPIAAQEVAKRYHVRVYKKASDLKNPWVNVTLGVLYLKHLRTRFSHKTNYLSAYNLGPKKMQQLEVPKLGVKGLDGVRRYIASIKKAETGFRNFR